MARHSFGGDMAAWVFEPDGDDNATLIGGSTLTFWNAQSGGTQYTDLAQLPDGTGAIDHVNSSDGTDGYNLGQIPIFYGPDNIWIMWASANGGSRVLLLGSDTPDYVKANLSSFNSLSADFSAHVAAVNPHSTQLGDLTNVSVSAVVDGEVLGYDAGTSTWVPINVSGVSGVVTQATEQTISATKTFQQTNASKSAIIIRAKASPSPQVEDTLICYSETGQRTTYLNEHCELRVICAKPDSIGVRIKGQPLQTTHVLEQTDIDNNPISWWEPNGSWRAPNLGHVISFSISGAITVGTGTHRIYNDTGVPLTVRAIRANLGTAPTGTTAIFDVNRNGTTLFSTQGNRPTVPIAGNTSGKVTAINTTVLNDGDYVTVDVDQIGSGTAGSNLTVSLLCY